MYNYSSNTNKDIGDGNAVTFFWYDYLLFSCLLGFSILTGIYHGFCGRKESTAAEYLLGSRNMNPIPIGMSLVASFFSGIALLAIPADVYKYGAGYSWAVISILIDCYLTLYVLLPIYRKLNITSTYEYLEKRFDYSIRLIGSLLFSISVLLYAPLVIYMPALAFETATGIDEHVTIVVLCVVCIFYTTLGGIKAVVWTDILQFSITVVGSILIFIVGIVAAGGLHNIWEKSKEGNRLDLFDFDLDPTKRETFWITLIGFTFKWMKSFGVHQGFIQKFLTLSTYKDVKISMSFFVGGIILINIIVITTGLIMFTLYGNCDLFITGKIKKNDNLVPFYVLDVAKQIPGLPGIFIVGVFGASLSTLSADLNSISAIIFEDFIRKINVFPQERVQEHASTILKMIVVIVGVICAAMVLLIERLGDVWSVFLTLDSITAGPLVGLFILGIFVPKANSKGAMWGTITSLIIMSWIIFTSMYYKNIGLINYPPKPLSTNSCLGPVALNQTISVSTQLIQPENDVFYVYRISFIYYALIGSCITILTGMVVSYITHEKNEPIDKNLLWPGVHFLVKKDNDKKKNSYHSIKEALDMVTYNTKT